MARPRVTLRCVADAHTDKSRERIVEFFDPVARKGGLIALRRLDDGSLLVQPYQLDHGVHVTCPADPNEPRTKALLGVLPILLAAQWTKPEWFQATRAALEALRGAGVPDAQVEAAGRVEAPSDKALAACRALCDAYQRGADNDSSMDWSDVDAAWELAKAAVAQAEGR